MSLPTLDDLKPHLNSVSSTNDAELQDMLDAAVEVVEGIVGPIGEPATVTETHRDVYSDVLVLRRMPVGALVSVGFRYGVTTTPMTLGDFEVDTASGLLRRTDGGRFAGSFTVSYTSGLSVLPAGIRLAVLIVAAHLWETQRMPGQPIDSAPAGFGGADSTADASFSGRGYAIPNRAQELLQPYMRPVIA